MQWLKAADAAREWCGGVHPKTLYAAVKAGKLKAARIGAGRNLLFSDVWIDEWLQKSAGEPQFGQVIKGESGAGRL
jgi:hypothetical protein